jgi:O-antigen ligase
VTAPGRTIERPTRRAATDSERAALAAGALIILGALGAGILAADAPLLVVVGASALFLAIAMVLRPDVATVAAIAVIYSNAAVVLVRFHGMPPFAAAFVPALLLVPAARDLVVRRLPLVVAPAMGWMIVLLGVYVISALFSAETQRSWDAVTIFLTEGFLLYFLIINVIRGPALLRSVTWALLGSGAFVSVFAVHQVITGNFDSNYLGFAQADTTIRTGVTTLTGEVLQPRMAGSIGETNRFAQTMLMLVPLGIFRVVDERSTVLRLIAGIFTFLITMGVILSFSRGAAVGLAALVVALMAMRMIRARYVLVVILTLGLILAAFPQYTNRITSLLGIGAPEGTPAAVDNSLLSRITETAAAGLVMLDHPLIGVGPAMFPVYYEPYANTVGILVRDDAEREAHNLYLGVGAELGIPGLIVFLIVGLSVVRALMKARRASIVRRPDLERLTTPFLLALFTYYVTGMFLHLSFARFFWVVLAVATAAALITLREVASEQATNVRGEASARRLLPQRPLDQSV